MKKLRVIVKDKTTLILDESGSQGDLIDLNELVTIDQNPILEAIKRGTDSAYARYFEQNKQLIELENEKELSKLKADISDKQHQIAELKIQMQATLAQVRRETLDQANASFKKVEDDLKASLQATMQELATLKATNESYIASETIRLKSASQQELSDKQNTILLLKQQISSMQEKQTMADEMTLSKQQVAIAQLHEQYRLEISKLTTEIDYLTRERSARNVKKIGENLEKWCLEKYLEINAFAFITSTFEKDNEAIKEEREVKGTKGDYIFKVYTDRAQSLLLTSAMCEMKSEALESENRKRNQDHYAKLDRDRNKKGLEYAILISELEYTSEADAPIFRVAEYEKMFVVRPAYFITLLGIIESIGMKYADLVFAKHQEKISFQESTQILSDFEAFKENLLNNALRHIASQLDEIKRKAQTIINDSTAIINAINVIIDSHLETVRNKINNFSIRTLTKRIERLDQ